MGEESITTRLADCGWAKPEALERLTPLVCEKLRRLAGDGKTRRRP